MERVRVVDSSHEYFEVAIVENDTVEDSWPVAQPRRNSGSDGKFHLQSLRTNLSSALQKNKISRSLLRICTRGSKGDTGSFLPPTLQCEENKPDSFRFIVAINRLAKLVLIYFNNPLWKYIGLDILPAMHEYRDACINLLKALIKNIKMPRRYTCFLNLLPKAVAQDLVSILKNFRQDFAREEPLGIRNIIRGLWRSSELQYFKLRPELDGFALQEMYNSNISVEDNLLICLSNIQHLAALFAYRYSHVYGEKSTCIVDSPIDMQIERVKDVRIKMGGVRQSWAEKLEIETCSCESLGNV